MRGCIDRKPRVGHLAALGASCRDPGMNSRVRPKYKTKYRVGNWTEYDRALVQPGDITLWLATDAIAAWKPAQSGSRDGQRKFSDQAIETALVLRLVCELLLRQAEGLLRSVLLLSGVNLENPDHTTPPRRSQRLDIPPASPGEEHLLSLQDDHWPKTWCASSGVTGELWPIGPQRVEEVIAGNILNTMTALGRAKSFTIGS